MGAARHGGIVFAALILTWFTPALVLLDLRNQTLRS
jgi:hypothetical protein